MLVPPAPDPVLVRWLTAIPNAARLSGGLGLGSTRADVEFARYEGV